MSEGTAAKVGHLLKRARKRYGCTQVELAKAAGTDQSTVARIEAGRTVPTLDMIARLAAATGHTALLRLTAGPRAWQTAL